MGAAAGYGATQFTFHYASTLIDIDFSVPQAWTPFTFHYASTLMNLRGKWCWNFQIYIPLCFYFNIAQASMNGVLTVFTFHYASTLIYFPYSYSIFAFAFTFHYASTLIYHHADPSTFSVHIYIPLCFYFDRSKKVEELAKEIYLHSTMLLL